ncbi:hypothetical protein N0V83_010915 [Neocucurbitaria cava]|uniref:Uncharacterized protein n=1 Tax=Neocucurbitaria cava TaxID=798079 RepID=A0A9W8Y0A1_9PLEO|nr:hypothetical protein N0V83_010915 [Neocucurbitaria cava]
MAARADGELTPARATPLGQDEGARSVSSSGTATDVGSADDSVDDKDDLKSKMMLLWAERKNTDLEQNLRESKNEKEALKAQVVELQAELHAVRAVSIEEHGQMVAAIEAKRLSQETAEEAKQHADRLRTKMRTMQGKNEGLVKEVKILQLKLEEAILRTEDTSGTAELIAQLEKTHAAYKDKIALLTEKNTQLINKNDELTAKHFAASETIKKNESDVNFYRAKCENKEHDIDRLKSNIANMRKEKQERESSIKITKANVAYYITCLDMADAGYRHFTCAHDNLGNVPDGRNTTQQAKAFTVATMLFKEWQHDKYFIEQYIQTRVYQVEHHRAHEKVNQGRGDFSENIYNTFLAVDKTRNATISGF